MNFVHTGMISSQGCEPKTESRFFGRFFSVFPDRKPTFLNRFFGCPKKQKPKNRLGFFGRFFRLFATENRLFEVGFSVAQKKRNRKTHSVFFGRFFFHVPVVKNTYISVWKRRYGWTHGQLRHTAAAAAAVAAAAA